MTKTILVCGHGPGISQAVAQKFGREGFRVAIAARSADKLDAAVKHLAGSGIEAKAFPTDLSSPEAVRELVTAVQTWSPITVLHWNGYPSVAGDLTTASLEEIHGALDIGVTSLLVAVQGALPDLRKQERAAVLVTGGGLAFHDPNADRAAVSWGSMGLAMVKAAQHKIVGLLSERLKADGIYVGSVVVRGIVKGTSFDRGNGSIEAASIAEQFWQLYEGRQELWVSAFG